ncbi:MAG: hypothetical protein D4S00_09250 [Streptomycetaceae bacterium]|nr:MAG: hypothetical protein D4S00_09250 [Streptomycetaceae bacterium]
MAILLILLFAFETSAPSAVAKITPGSACSKVGATSKFNGKIYTCIKSGKKLVWDKGKNIVQPTPTLPTKPSPLPNPTRTTIIFPPKSSASAITQPPVSMVGINDQHWLFSGGMDPNSVTLGPKTGTHPEFGSYDGKSGVNFEIGFGLPILAPIDARFIGFNNRNADYRSADALGPLRQPFDDLALCFESTGLDWPGMIFCFYHLKNSPLLLGINKSPLCSNATEWPGPLRAEGWQFYTNNDGYTFGNSISASCQGLLGRTVKRGDVIAYSGTVGTHSQAPITMKVPDKSINPTIIKGDKNLHWVQGDAFFYWKCFAQDAIFEKGVLAYPWECGGYQAPREQRLVSFKYTKP